MKLPSPRTAVFLIVLLDVMGFGLIIPSQPFLAKSLGASAAVVTLLGTVYSAMQFIFAPVWGSISDRLGRRPVLVCTILMTLIGHATFAAASSLFMLFLARALAGTGAANIATAQAVLADTHAPEQRSRAMALIGAAFGLGFIFGPALGGILFQIDHRAPAAFGAILAGVNLCFMLLALPETRVTTTPAASHTRSLKELKTLPGELRKLVSTTLLFIVAFSLMEQSVGLFIERHWVHTPGQRGLEEATSRTSLFLVVVGVTATLVQGFLVRKWLPKVREKFLMQAGLAVIAFSLLSIPVLGTLGIFPVFLLTGAALAFGSGLFNPSIAGLVSLASPPEKQGFGLAINQSAAALGRVIGPTLAGTLFAMSHNAPFFVGALLTLVALALASRTKEPLRSAT
jgi:DHA1 family tetracycline resistance protein-like MFS transporter